MEAVWTNYNDLSQGHPKMWFGKEISPKYPGIIVICPVLLHSFLAWDSP